MSNDTFNIVNATIGTPTRNFKSGFDAGDGNDSFNIDGTLNQNDLGYFSLNMGVGNDAISIKRARFEAIELNYYAGSPGSLNVDLFKINVRFTIDISLLSSNPATVNVDSVTTAGIRINRDGASGYTGHNQISISNLTAQFSEFFLGSGNDSVSIVDSVFSGFRFSPTTLDVRLGAGNDSLTLKNVTVKTTTRLDGGADADQLIDQGGNSLGTLTSSGFES